MHLIMLLHTIMHSTHTGTYSILIVIFQVKSMSISSRLSNHVLFSCSRWLCKWQVKTRSLKNTLHLG